MITITLTIFYKLAKKKERFFFFVTVSVILQRNDTPKKKGNKNTSIRIHRYQVGVYYGSAAGKLIETW